MKHKPTKNRRPWNRVNQQVYSLSTCDSKGNINMNIVTYATPATLKPKSYVIAVYRNTKTHSNLFNKPNTHFLLQGLSSVQTKQIRTLGQKSGLKYDKVKYLTKQNLQYYELKNESYGYLPDCGFVLLCKLTNSIKHGDHDLITADVVKIIADNKEAKLLTTQELIDKGIIL
jgi:flavin reductase (DIM6/NTAB) family NADH-FMN oxidoreductase RutF